MTHAVASEFRSIIGQRIEAEYRVLASRWLEQLTTLVPVDPNDIFPGEQLREMGEARGVDVRVAGPLPAIEIDVARLELVLVNLVSNAIKYSDPDKPQRIVEIGRVPDDSDRICTLSVRDNGIGIAETDLRSIFARFYRGRPQRDRELGTSGLGLGLAIAAECVDALKGDIRVESTLGEGTTFFLELPVSPDAPVTPRTASGGGAGASRAAD
ncbi:MAG: sensor histidine kinase [Acidobacteria bacterium]|nr:sensor histidine kinase [Acidobacteriota bacterium]